MHQRDDSAHRSGGGAPRPSGGNLAWIPPAERLLSTTPPPSGTRDEAQAPERREVDRRAVRVEGLALLSELALDD